MAEHLLNAPQVGAALEQVRRERMAEQMRVDAGRVEAGLRGAASEDEECAGARERAAARVEKELRAVAAVEVRPTAREVAAHGVRRLAAADHAGELGAGHAQRRP